MGNLIENLKKYFETTPKDQILKHWEETKSWDEVGVKTDQFICSTMGESISSILLEKECVKLDTEKMFTWTSGIKSPIYCDNRKILSYPREWEDIIYAFTEIIQEEFEDVEYIAGVATAGIPHGALIAMMMKLPFVYVRTEPKKHGLGNQIEGYLPEGKKVLLIEDLISTGKSSLAAIKPLLEKNSEIVGICSIFSYNSKKSLELFKEQNLKVISLTNFDELVSVAQQKGIINSEMVKELKNWKENNLDI